MSTNDVNPFAAPTTVETETPGQRWIGTDSPELRRVGVGLGLVYFGIVTILLTLMLTAFLAAIVGPTMLLLMGAGMFIGATLLVIGPILCLAVPEETGAKGLIVGSVICQLGNMIISISGVFVLMPSIVAFAGGILNMVGTILFVLFMRKLSQFIDRVDLAQRAKLILLLGLGMAMALIVVMVAVRFLPAIVLLLIPLGIGMLVTFMMYANLVNSLRKLLWK